MSVMPSPRCSFNVNGALLFVPSTWNPEGALVCGFEGVGVTGRGTDTGGLGGVVAGAFGLLLAGVVDPGRLATFGLILAAGLDRAFRDGDLLLVRLTVPALFAPAALAFADFVFFLATMRTPSSEQAMSRGVADDQTTTKVDGQARTSDRNISAKTVPYAKTTPKSYAFGRVC